MQSSARFSTLQSRLVLKRSREFASTTKIPASALRFATKAVSTSMEEVAEGDAIWDDDLTAGFSLGSLNLVEMYFHVLEFLIFVSDNILYWIRERASCFYSASATR